MRFRGLALAVVGYVVQVAAKCFTKWQHWMIVAVGRIDAFKIRKVMNDKGRYRQDRAIANSSSFGLLSCII